MRLLLALFVVILAVVVVMMLHRPLSRPNHPLAAQSHSIATMTNAPSLAARTNALKLSAAAAVALPDNPGFQERPFPVGYESSSVQWTLADGKDTNVIRQLAHNPLEYARMVEENSRIFKRQLVYLKETAAAVFENARLTGAPVKQLTLPGVDGQELQFQIVKSDGDGSSRQGMFSGHLAGNLDSQVSLAFMDGREAYTVLAPKENIYVVGEPRENGQVIVKAIDPNTYGVEPAEAGGDDFIKTAGPVDK